MSNEIYLDQLLDDHLQGKISLTELKDLAGQETAASLEDVLALHRAAAIAIQRHAAMVQVKKVHEAFLGALGSSAADPVAEQAPSGTKKTQAPVIAFKWVARIAAVLILLAGTWLAYMYTTTTSAGLYAEIYEPYSVNTDRNLVTDISPHNMVEEYRNKNYARVIEVFKSLPNTNNREKFLVASAYHETGFQQEAVQQLQEIIVFNKLHNGRLYQDEAEFFLGLCYLKMNRNAEALSMFRKIYEDPGHTFHAKVSKWTIVRLRWAR